MQFFRLQNYKNFRHANFKKITSFRFAAGLFPSSFRLLFRCGRRSLLKFNLQSSSSDKNSFLHKTNPKRRQFRRNKFQTSTTEIITPATEIITTTSEKQTPSSEKQTPSFRIQTSSTEIITTTLEKADAIV